MRARILTGLTAVLLAWGVAPAEAKRPAPELRLVASEAIGLATDGERYAVWQPASGDVLAVLDTAGGRQWRVPRAPECRPGGLRSVTAAGRALLTCRGTIVPSRLVDLREGSAVALPDTVDVDGDPAKVEWRYVGRRWVEGSTTDADFDYGEGRAVFYDWRTEELRSVPELDGDRDIDDPGLGRRRYCRRYDADEDGRDARIYEAPFFLTGTTGYDYRRLALASCDGGPRRLLQRSAAYEQEVHLSSGLVTWTVPRTITVRAHHVRLGRTYSWRLGRSAPRSEHPAAIWPVRRGVIVAETLGDAVPERARVYRARLPR